VRNGEEEAQKNDEWKQNKPRPAKPKEVEVRGNIDGLLQELENKLGTPLFSLGKASHWQGFEHFTRPQPFSRKLSPHVLPILTRVRVSGQNKLLDVTHGVGCSRIGRVKIRLSSGHPQVSKENAGPGRKRQPDFTEAWSTVGGNSFNTMFPNRHKAYWNYDTHGQLLNTTTGGRWLRRRASNGRAAENSADFRRSSGRVTECSRKRWEAG
jgi:hypothetical protein